MLRLQGAAEDALASNDPSGASLFSGRAALMASQLAERQSDPRERALLQGREVLFRAQERVYRGLAMYKLGGGMPPASTGVCGMIDQGARMAESAVKTAREQLGAQELTTNLHDRLRELEDLTVDLEKNAKAIRSDVQCP